VRGALCIQDLSTICKPVDVLILLIWSKTLFTVIYDANNDLCVLFVESGLKFLFDVKTTLNISDITFYPSQTTHGYDLYASATDKEDILFLNLVTGKPTCAQPVAYTGNTAVWMLGCDINSTPSVLTMHESLTFALISSFIDDYGVNIKHVKPIMTVGYEVT